MLITVFYDLERNEIITIDINIVVISDVIIITIIDIILHLRDEKHFNCVRYLGVVNSILTM